MELIQRIQCIIEQHGLLKKGDGIIVGCSGGPDSMCLLHLLMQLRGPMDLTIRAVHLEHGFRGEASEMDARYVEEYCQRHGIDCVIHRETVRELARQAGISEETAGREARYRLFFREKSKLEEELGCGGNADMRDPFSETIDRPCVKIAVAHNKNDQAETVLMRIMRGTGLDGLAGMELIREDGIIRPLLTTDRSEIEAYCEEYGLDPQHDHTNEETDYTRNRIRLELIPYMKKNFNENVEDALCRLGTIAEEARTVIRNDADRVMEAMRKNEEGLIVDRKALAELEDGLRHAVIRRTLDQMGLTMNVAMIHLQQIDALLKSDSASGSVDLPRGYRVAVAYGDILWGSSEKKMPSDLENASVRRNFPIPADAVTTQECQPVGEISVREEERTEEWTISALRNLPENIKCFDGDKIGDGKLILRFRKPGDHIRPLGSPGRKKLQNWFVDQKIPRQVRDTIPLVCIGSEVLWITGHRISENYKVEEQTKRLIFVEFHQ